MVSPFVFFGCFRFLCLGLVWLVGLGPSSVGCGCLGWLGSAWPFGFVGVPLAVFAWVRFFSGGLVFHPSNGGFLRELLCSFCSWFCLRGL